MRRTILLSTLALVPLLACGAPENAQPSCRSEPPTILMAESVPGAALIPCVRAVPAGWTYDTFEANDTTATFSLHETDGDGVLLVQLRPSCDAAGSPERVAGFPDAQRYRSVESDGAHSVWTTTFPGGCTSVDLTFPAAPATSDVARVERTISFIPRTELHP
jgi:hypothetical protein